MEILIQSNGIQPRSDHTAVSHAPCGLLGNTIKVLFFASCLGLFACSVEPNNAEPTMPRSTQASASAELNASARPQTEVSREPTPQYEQVNDRARCKIIDFESVQPTLNHPVDLVVNADGSKVYILNKKPCFVSASRFRQFSSSTPLLKAPFCDFDNLPRTYIQELDTLTSELKLLKVKGNPPLSCEIEDELEIDSEGHLYVNSLLTQSLYKIDLSQQNIENLNKVKKTQSGPDLSASPTPKRLPSLEGPVHLYLEQEQLYFALSALAVNLDEQIYRSDQKGVLELLYDGRGLGQEYLPFAVYQGKVNIEGFRWLKPPYPKIGRSELVSFDFTREGTETVNGRPHSFRFNGQGDLFYITQNQIFKYTFRSEKEAHLSLVAGTEQAGLKDASAREAQFNFPLALAFDHNDNLYIADTGNHAIRKMTPEGQVTTLYVEAQGSNQGE